MSWAILRRRIDELETTIVELLHRDRDNQRRIANIIRPGKVAEINDAASEYKVEWGKDDKGQPLKTGWIPMVTRAGKIKVFEPPSVGEQVMIFSPSGEMGPNSWCARGGFSTANPPNHNKDGEYMITIGGTVFHLTKEGLTIKAKKMKVESGKVEYEKKPPQDPGEPPAQEAPPVTKPSVPTESIPMS